MWEWVEENRYWMEGEERRCRMCYEERETIEYMWNGHSEMRERERKERGEIPTEWRRKGDRMDEKDMEEEKQNGKRKVWRIKRKTLFFWNCYFYF
jgi:hypothetical protein